MIEEREHVGDVWRERGKEIRVRICDAGNGPRIDVREFITPEAYKDSDTARARRAGGHVVTEGRKQRVTKAQREYTGPTKAGLWLDVRQAEELCELLASALVKAGDLAVAS